MADPNLEELPDFHTADYDIVHQGLRMAYNKNDNQAVERLTAAWQTEKDVRIEAWNARQEEEARLEEEANHERQHMREQEEHAAAEEIERQKVEEERKKPKMNTFAPSTAAPDDLVHPPSQYALQKLQSFNYVKLWYFLLPERLDAANRRPPHDAFHCLSLSIQKYYFLQAADSLLDYAKLAKSPGDNIDALSVFFWCQPLGERIVLTYASHVHQHWHRELKAYRGFDISVINLTLISSIICSKPRVRNQQSRSPAPAWAQSSGREWSPTLRHPHKSSCSPKPAANGSRAKSNRSACLKCLGHDPHDVRHCLSKTLWDGSPAHCSCDTKGNLVNPEGQIICTSWQHLFGCLSKHASVLHECSGCGSTEHGAQTCPQTQKA
ncbi:hypothetical protein V8E55_002332 [Tylopilus felleus]